MYTRQGKGLVTGCSWTGEMGVVDRGGLQWPGGKYDVAARIKSGHIPMQIPLLGRAFFVTKFLPKFHTYGGVNFRPESLTFRVAFLSKLPHVPNRTSVYQKKCTRRAEIKDTEPH